MSDGVEGQCFSFPQGTTNFTRGNLIDLVLLETMKRNICQIQEKYFASLFGANADLSSLF